MGKSRSIVEHEADKDSVISAKYRSPLRFIYLLVRPYWKQIVLWVFLLFMLTGLKVLQPLVMTPMIDVVLRQVDVNVSGETQQVSGEPLDITEVNLNNADEYVSQVLNLANSEPWQIVLFLSVAYLVISIFIAAVTSTTFYIYTWVRIHAYRNVEAEVFGHLLSLSMDYFNIRRSGEIVSRLSQDTHAAVTSLANIIRALASAPFSILFYGFLLARTNLGLMLLAALIGVLQWVVVRVLRTRLRELVISEFDMIARVGSYLQEVFQNIRIVKSFVAEKFEGIRLNRNVGELIPIHIKRALYRHAQEPIVSLINAAANIGILVLSARELLNGNLTIPGFFLFLYLGRAMIPPITELGQTYLGIEEMQASAQRLFQIVSIKSSIVNGSQKITGFTDHIEFKNVSFGYGDETVLNKVSISISRGQMVAIVGPSGAGKSTLTDLLLRLYDPTAGEILIDGQDLRNLEVESYRRLFGVVAQENLLFNATIAENIAYGRSNISMGDIEASAKVANASDFIEGLPNKYQTFVGDRGIRLSGGQRQRIAIARAIVHNPEILIMDEATSSLDTESERFVQSAIDAVIKGTTAVVVAHRLSTVIHADKIIVLENGRILDQGKHAELYERCPLYRRLCDLQFNVDTPKPPLPDTENLVAGLGR